MSDVIETPKFHWFISSGGGVHRRGFAKIFSTGVSQNTSVDFRADSLKPLLVTEHLSSCKVTAVIRLLRIRCAHVQISEYLCVPLNELWSRFSSNLWDVCVWISSMSRSHFYGSSFPPHKKKKDNVLWPFNCKKIRTQNWGKVRILRWKSLNYEI